ncbi:MAG: DUF1905 domain-containing protein [Nocardioidaceae bacterium]
MATVGTFDLVVRLWQHPSAGGWHFVAVPPEVGAEIADLTGGTRRGFGSVRVEVTVGATSWRTSVFPDAASGGYLLPVKQAVRRAERLEAGDELAVRVVLADL